MSSLPKNLYRAAQVRELDRIAIETYSIPGIKLMEHAGQAVFSLIQSRWPQAKRIAVLCGVGNNGGDGYIVARLASVAGIDCVIYQLGDLSRQKGDALTAYNDLDQANVQIHQYVGQSLQDFDVIVDALLGIGISGEVIGPWRDAIYAINQAAQRNTVVVAVDIPSGLDADTGALLGVAVKAELTVTFIGLKQGLLTAVGSEQCGEIVFDSLQVPDEVYRHQSVAGHRIDLTHFRHVLPKRSRAAHKGQYGQVLLVGGNHAMLGAIQLAAIATCRVGAGITRVATRQSHALAITLARPEVMCHGIETVSQLRDLFKSASIIAIGPGLGQDTWAQEMLGSVLQSSQPLVVDADALNLLAIDPVRRDNWVLTPHPGEAARLLNCSREEIQNNRFAAVSEIQKKYGGIAVLKGCGTLVANDHGGMSLCNEGNPGMASAGMGDVLTGLTAGLMAQGLALDLAAEYAVCLHAAAGDAAAKEGEKGLLASDLLQQIRRLIN